MRTRRIIFVLLICVCGHAACTEVTAPSAADDTLPSWNEGPARNAVIAFVQAVTDEAGKDYVPADDRIAVFDNDGTLWSEQPLYFQLYYVLDALGKMAQANPSIADVEPYTTALRGNRDEILSLGTQSLLDLVAATHGNQTNAVFGSSVRQWAATATHPESQRLYTSMVYQPMLELMNYLRANQFRVYIVTGGGVEFLRAFAEDVYGVPPYQVIGSRIDMVYELTADGPRLQRQPKISFVNDGPGKPIAIQQVIGQKPTAAFGNSDGDLQMLQWTAAAEGRTFIGIVHHTDGEREWAYDRDSHIGHLDKALDEAATKGWTVVDMKKDWRVIYP